MKRTLACALAVLCLVLLACGDEEETGDSVANEVTIGQILEDPAAYVDRAVIVRGASVVPLEPAGFVLEDDGQRLLVSATEPVPGIQAGEQVGVRGEVARFSERGADELQEGLGDLPALDETPTERGDPYLVFRALAGGR